MSIVETNNGSFSPVAAGRLRQRLRCIAPSLKALIYTFPISFILGASIGLGLYPVVAAIVAVFAVGSIVSRPRLAIWIALLGALVVSGLVQLYLPAFQMIRWGFALLGMALGAVILAQRLWSKAGEDPMTLDCRRVLIWGAGFFISALFASFIASNGFGAMISGLKGYFQMWGLLLAIAFLGFKPAEANRIMLFLAALALVQLPFALQQFFVLVPLRNNAVDLSNHVVPVDIVAGTFGGILRGGGHSMDLAALASIAVGIIVALWRAGRLSTWKVFLAAVVMLAPMALNEAKFVIVALPLVMLFVFRDKVLRNPVQFFVGSAFMASVLAGFILAYTMLPGFGSQKQVSLGKYAQEMISYNFGEKGYGRAYLNRTTVYSHWFGENVKRGRWDKVLFGYGPGATNSGASVGGTESLATTRYRGYAIGLTGVSALLWEIGVFGVCMVVGLFFSLYRTASRLCAASSLASPHGPFLLAAQAAIPVLAFSLLVTNFFVFELGFQAMFVAIAGYVLCMSNALHGGGKGA